MTPLSKGTYLACRKKYKEPIILLHVIYNIHCDSNKRIASLSKFEGMLKIWLGNKGYKLMHGVLLILKYFDKKFA